MYPWSADERVGEHRRLIPTLQFEIVDVMVRGWPWRTQVLTRFIDRIALSN